MVRWLSESEALCLPKEKVDVTYLSSDTFENENKDLIRGCLKSLGRWGSNRLFVWTCKNMEELDDAQKRIVPEVTKDSLEINRVLKPEAMLIYVPQVTQAILSLHSKRALEPNLLMNLTYLENCDRNYKRASVIHEFSHKFEVDLKYSHDVVRAFLDIFENQCSSPFQQAVAVDLKTVVDDQIADETAVGYGFKEDVFTLRKNFVGAVKLEEQQHPRTKQFDWVYPVLKFKLSYSL